MGHTNDSAEAGSELGALFPIVAIGASAGGLEALRQLFTHVPGDTGMAFIVIQHLDPGRPSMLTSVLAADVCMPVVEVANGMRAEPNRVHVIPPGADLGIERGVLTLVPRGLTGNLHLPIDSFFRALAGSHAGLAIGVVLSGSASDGTEGLRAIKAAGGVTFAQEPDSAQFRSMPDSAIAAGVADFRMSPEEIAHELVRLSRHPYLDRGVEETALLVPARDEPGLASIMAEVRRHAQLDLRGYKRPTILRRIARRMALGHHASVEEYAASLHDDAAEAKALAQDILIHVTAFFRDPDAFAALGEQVLPELLKRQGDDATIRIWVPGCSTGEEAYSLAICVLEVLSAAGREVPVKIFGSDLSERAIEGARAGLYDGADLDGVSPERLARFFEHVGSRYRIAKRVRDLCVFVRHDLTRDPPFARLHLISCRNILIYFDVDLQRRVLHMLHHCLRKPGYLFLGHSEAIAGFGDLFAAVDKEHRIFLATGESPRAEYPPALGREAESHLPDVRPMHRPQPARDAQRQADHILLARYAPPGVIVDERLEVVQFRGRTGGFLEAPPGQPQLDLLRMARTGLASPLRDALETAKARSATVRRRGVRITEDARTRLVDFEVVPLPGADAAERYFLVIFEDSAGREAAEGRPATATTLEPVAPSPPDEEAARLEAELVATRAYLQALTGEHQETAEELAAANEELLAANEELQSANEELQSAKEELQSTNEELTTLNDELRSRNQQLDVVASDLVNVLESTRLPVIMVDQALRIRRFTPAAAELSSLLPTDVGRSIDDVKLKVEVDDLADRIRQTIQTAAPKEWEVQGLDGRWFRLHIRPYRTQDDRLEGAILSLIDVDVLKRAVEDAVGARDYAQGIVETVPVPLVVLDAGLRIVSANPAFCRRFALPPKTAGRAALLELEAGAWDVPALREALERSQRERAPFADRAIQCTFPGGHRADLLVAGCPIRGTGGELLLLLAIEDVTERRTLAASEKRARLEAEQANRAKDIFLATLSHELRTPLSAILMSAQILQRVASEDPKIQRASAAIERAVGNQVRLIDDLLDVSRIVSGKLTLDLQAVDLATVVQSAVDFTRGYADAKGIELVLTSDASIGHVYGDPVRLQQVVANLLENSIKFTPRGGRVGIRLAAVAGHAQITVTDTGIGIRGELLPALFGRFFQAEGAITRSHGGLGLGLAIVRHLVDMHGGEVVAESPGEGGGATFTVTLPLSSGVVAPRTAGPSAAPAGIVGARVLLIEDDDDTREASTAVLEELGAQVRPARSAAEGLAAIDTFRPQVILCDIAMPGEDGYTFIRTLRSRGEDRGGRTPAAALTALAGPEDRQRALAAGFQLHLAKPIDAAQLASAICTLAALPER